MNEEFDNKEENEKMSYSDFQKRNISNAMQNWKNAGLWEKLWMILLGIIVGGGIIAVFVFFFLKMFVFMGAIIGALLIFVPIVILIAILVQKQHLQKDKINWQVPAKSAKVLSCALYTETANTKNVKGNKGEVEILTSVYKMKVDIDGRQVTVYDNKKHAVGEIVQLRQHQRNKKILIVE